MKGPIKPTDNKNVGALSPPSPPVLPGMLLKCEKWAMRVLRHLISY